jgi:HTH-type transcriptional regulator / antitoxin HigA
MNNTRTFRSAEAFHPGVYIREELAARHWSQGDFAAIIGRPLQAINEIVNGKKRITAETALAIGAAFGTGPEVWVNLQSAYDLHRAGEADPAIAQRARRYAKSA